MIFSKSSGNGVMSAMALAFVAMASIHCGTDVVPPASDGAGTTGGGGQSTAAGTGGAQTSATGGTTADPLCVGAALCDRVYLGDTTACMPGWTGPPPTVPAARCVLEKLRDRAPGFVAIQLDVYCTATDNNGSVNELVSFGDGSVSVSHRSYLDIGATSDPSIRRELKPVSYFEGCLAGDDAGVLTCVQSLYTDTAVDGDTCACRGGPKGSLAGECDTHGL
jgi:hypothetical protein